MTEKRESQYLVSRRNPEKSVRWTPYLWFDARADARAWVKLHEGKRGTYYKIDRIKRGPHS
ncbi:MAG TPA: hypothetical protein VFH85_07940 [Gammaproteobacteria bacterium]|nr:hypothetical protein [Gammaproteobacteria bacterium]